MPNPDVRFTIEAAEYLREMKAKSDGDYALIIVESCKLGWASGMFFPFEIGLIVKEQVENDFTLEIANNIKCPHGFPVYIDKNIKATLPDLTIIDFQTLKEIELLFIPPILKPMQEYQFFS